MSERQTTHNSTYKKLAVQCSADSFVVNQSLVLRINICGENRQLLVAAKRYQQCYETQQPTVVSSKRRQTTESFRKQLIVATLQL
jgi:hypothetical protein